MTWKSLIWEVLNFIVFVIDLAGIPDNIRQWKEWFKGWLPMLLGYEPISWLFMLVGGSLFILGTFRLWMWLFLIKRRDRKKPEKQKLRVIVETNKAYEYAYWLYHYLCEVTSRPQWEPRRLYGELSKLLDRQDEESKSLVSNFLNTCSGTIFLEAGKPENADEIKQAYFRLRDHMRNAYIGLSEPQIRFPAPFDFEDILTVPIDRNEFIQEARP